MLNNIHHYLNQIVSSYFNYFLSLRFIFYSLKHKCYNITY